MADETRTVLKDFNRDLLIEELLASIVPFETLDMAGFVRQGQFIATPAPGPRVIAEDKVANTQDIAQPGELRFVVTSVLSGVEAVALDAALSSHVSTVRTAEQTRLEQDDADLNTLEIQFPNFDTFDNTQFRNYTKLLARVVIRQARQSAI